MFLNTFFVFFTSSRHAVFARAGVLYAIVQHVIYSTPSAMYALKHTELVFFRRLLRAVLRFPVSSVVNRTNILYNILVTVDQLTDELAIGFAWCFVLLEN